MSHFNLDRLIAEYRATSAQDDRTRYKAIVHRRNEITRAQNRGLAVAAMVASLALALSGDRPQPEPVCPEPGMVAQPLEAYQRSQLFTGMLADQVGIPGGEVTAQAPNAPQLNELAQPSPVRADQACVYQA